VAAAACWHDLDLIFCNGAGGPLDGRNLIRSDFYPLLVRASLPRVRFHDLRHSSATLLLSLGVPLSIVVDILGHSSTRVTGDTYTHVSVTMHRQAVDQLDTSLRPRRVSGQQASGPL
jgi:integrase